MRNLEFQADFAMRAAYYLGLPASGPVPLPRKISRWTVIRSNFVHKKSQENFERITLGRLIQIKDGHPDTVQVWLAFLKKHAFYGCGMKATVWEHDSLGAGKRMDADVASVEKAPEPKWVHFGRDKDSRTAEKVKEILESAEYSRLAEEPDWDKFVEEIEEKERNAVIEEAKEAKAQAVEQNAKIEEAKEEGSTKTE